MRHWARSVAFLILIAAGANALPEEEAHVSLVPWKVLDAGEAVDAPLALFWIPSSPDELRRSPLLTSEELTLYASRCVAMRVVRFDDRARLASLAVDVDLPAAVLADRAGHVLAVAESDHGVLSVFDVEDLVHDELDARTLRAETHLDEARRHSEDGEVDSALELYRKVSDERCICPRQARMAQKALKRLEKR